MEQRSQVPFPMSLDYKPSGSLGCGKGTVEGLGAGWMCAGPSQVPRAGHPRL